MVIAGEETPCIGKATRGRARKAQEEGWPAYKAKHPAQECGREKLTSKRDKSRSSPPSGVDLTISLHSEAETFLPVIG